MDPAFIIRRTLLGEIFAGPANSSTLKSRFSVSAIGGILSVSDIDIQRMAGLMIMFKVIKTNQDYLIEKYSKQFPTDISATLF
jgi:hypothetical protein